MKSFLGDAVMATPLIDALLAEGREVGIATTESVRGLLDAPWREFDFIEMGRSRTLADTWRVSREIRRGRYGIALLVNRSFRSALSTFLAGVPVRSGHDTDRRRLLLTRSRPYDFDRNETECYLDLARQVGLELNWQEPKLYVLDEEKRLGQVMTCGAQVALQPGASYIGKRIPIPIQVEVIEWLKRRDLEVVLIGGKDELEITSELKSELGAPILDLVGKTDVRQVLGVLTNLRLTIGGDTGLMHLAAAAGCPSFTIFSGKPASKWAHGYPPHRFAEAPSTDMKLLRIESLLPVIEEVLGLG